MQMHRKKGPGLEFDKLIRTLVYRAAIETENGAYGETGIGQRAYLHMLKLELHSEETENLQKREGPYPSIPGMRVVDKVFGHARRRRGRQDRISSGTQVGTRFVEGLHVALESSVEMREAATMSESGSRGKRDF
ncbi:hypothetical protein ACLOJK_026919 [Asimina triloba]